MLISDSPKAETGDLNPFWNLMPVLCLCWGLVWRTTSFFEGLWFTVFGVFNLTPCNMLSDQSIDSDEFCNVAIAAALLFVRLMIFMLMLMFGTRRLYGRACTATHFVMERRTTKP